MPTGKIDEHLRAEFMETARSIIAKDRRARRSGLSQNTTGEISRALATAYLRGQAGSSPPPARAAAAVTDWKLIPPRAREVLSLMTVCFSSLYGGGRGEPMELAWSIEAGRKRWTAIRGRGEPRSTRSVADGSVQPLVRMGFIAQADPDGHFFAVTAEGLATGKEYWRRSDAGDPTLPVISLR